MKHRNFDVIVVGGGHAGTEAVLAAHRVGARAVLVTHRFDRLGEMSCNPAIGGLGKGHIVREIDALDGLMGRAADFAGTQFRLLNRRKGPAAQGPRTQADRSRYRRFVQNEFKRLQIEVIEGEVADLIEQGGRVHGVVLGDGTEIPGHAVVLTTGTFLRGMIHIGENAQPAGRVGDTSAVALGLRLESMGLPMGRLKTGTPPRLDGRTIDWTSIASQPADDEPEFLSFETTSAIAKQISCGITHTNARTHEIIERDLARSALYVGNIVGSGPRYCPSIEDKVVRFAEKDAHQIFLEPEGLNDDLVYPNGISTSLPADTQKELVNSMCGLEATQIVRPGYAIEYDYIDPRALTSQLEVKELPGLFLAGQINGTTGYEEAAGQGLVAGLNAAASVRICESLALARDRAYIGVMIDDLVTQGVSEPYRMFTSRAEYRLEMRADNADQRLTPLGSRLGCVGEERRRAFESKMEQLSAARTLATAIKVTPTQAEARGVSVNKDGAWRDLLSLLSLPDLDEVRVRSAFPEFAGVSSTTLLQLRREALYAPYLARQREEIELLRKDDAIPLPESLDYATMPGLSTELQIKLGRVRPTTLGQAGRIEGITPAALTLILMRARQARRAS